MRHPDKSLLCVVPTKTQQTMLAQVARTHRLGFLACAGEREALGHLSGNASLAAMIVAHRIADGDSLAVVAAARLSPAHATMPIAFVMSDRDPSLAHEAMNAGATEIFLRREHEALSGFVGEWASAREDAHCTGKALVVEDSASHAEYVAHLCQALGMQVDCAADVEAAERLLGSGAYQLVVVDVVLKDTKTGISLVRRIREDGASRPPILVMSGFDDLPRRLAAMKSGADDFISKPFTPEEFVWRVTKMMQGQARQGAAPQPVSGRAPAMPFEHLLSPRESEIFRMMMAGLGDRDIAAGLGISFWTVRSHVQQIFAKTGAINRRELMARCIPRETR